MSGRLTVIGIGPGPSRWITPAALEALTAATDIFGYTSYVERLALKPGQTVHRAATASSWTARARRWPRRSPAGTRFWFSGGDPGVFAMAAAVFEAIERGPKEWRAIDVVVEPGVTAMLAAAGTARRSARPRFLRYLAVGQPQALERHRKAAAARLRSGFRDALYNPASLARPEGIHRAFEVLRQANPETP